MGNERGGRLRRIFERLESVYGYQGWWPLLSRAGSPGYDDEGYLLGREWRDALTPSQRYEIVLGAILTQNTSWENAKRALVALRANDLAEPKALLSADSLRLPEVIRSSGYYNQKAAKLREVSEFLRAGGYLVRGQAPERERLLSIWGIGEESADSMLLYAFGTPLFVVDAYARRLLARLGIAGEKNSYASIQRLFAESIPPNSDLLGEYHALIVRHAKVHCRKKPSCAGCPLRAGCRFPRDHSPES